MNSLRRARLRGIFLACVGLLLNTLGCSTREALVDGLYGGISDTVAGAISTTLLNLLGLAGG